MSQKIQFFCDADTGIEIRGGRVYEQYQAGDCWYDGRNLGAVPMSETKARRIVASELRYCDAPTQAAALTALVGRHFAASEA
jgi:hypothetical protein